MKCEVCGCQYRKIDTSLVCQNGHTLQNMTEVAHDETVPSARSRRIRKKKKVKEFFANSGCHLIRMILAKLIFEEAKIFFEIGDDSVFKYFTGFFEFREGKLESSLDVNKEWMFALIYSAKRIECEKRGKALLLKDFLLVFSRFDLGNRLILIKNRFPSLEPAVIDLGVRKPRITMCTLTNSLDILSNPYTTSRPFKIPVGEGNGVYEECVDVCKANFRRLFKNDYKTAKPYFEFLCSKLDIEITEDLIIYFKKFIYTFNSFRVMLPEFDIAIFLTIFLINNHEFEGTQTEYKMLNHLDIPKTKLLSLVTKASKEMDSMASPEFFISLLRRKNRRRFKRLRNAIEFVEAFKVKKASRMAIKKLSKAIAKDDSKKEQINK